MFDESPMMEMDLAQLDGFTPEEERRIALSHVAQAFEEARLDGIEPNCIAMVAMFKAFAELVNLHGEEAVCAFTAALPDRVLSGEFSAKQVRH